MNAVYTSNVPRGSGLSSPPRWRWLLSSCGKLLAAGLSRPCDAPCWGKKLRTNMLASTAGSWTSSHRLAARKIRYYARLPIARMEAIRWPENVAIVIADTAVRRKLTSGEYNKRRAACEEAVRLLQQELPDIKALRDVSLEDFNRWQKTSRSSISAHAMWWRRSRGRNRLRVCLKREISKTLEA